MGVNGGSKVNRTLSAKKQQIYSLPRLSNFGVLPKSTYHTVRFELTSPNPYGLWLRLTGKGCQPMISLIHQCLPVSPSIIGVCINITKSYQKFR